MSRPALTRRLSGFGTSIFAEMTALARRHGAVNLGQGYPDFDGPEFAKRAAAEALAAGHNQYAPMPGLPALQRAVAAHQARFYGLDYDPEREVTIHAGATEALCATLAALLDPGDEAVVLEPFYDAYLPGIALAQARAVVVPLAPPEFRLDRSALEAAVTERTRVLVLNSPANPAGHVFTLAELQAIADVCVRHDVIAVTDEVYEHMVYDGAEHQSVARFEELAARSFIVSSFGKTYHVTGWKVGYVAAPAVLSAEFRKVHQFNVFTVNTPVQHGLAAFMADASHHLGLAAPQGVAGHEPRLREKDVEVHVDGIADVLGFAFRARTPTAHGARG